jgi:hypothetical protein
MRLKDAAATVLRDAKKPLSVEEIFAEIDRRTLFTFKAQQPKAVLSRTLRKHCEGVTMQLSSDTKLFKIVAGKYAIL